VDVTYATLTGVVAAGSADGDETNATAAYLVSAGLFSASAIYGIIKTQECNSAKDALRIRLMKIFEREARTRAAEQQRVRTPAPPRARTPSPPRAGTQDTRHLLEHPQRLPKRKNKRPVEPPPAEALPPSPPAPEGELSPAPPPPPAVTPAPAPVAPSSSAPPAAPPAPPPAVPPPAPAKSATPPTP
jgi:hypothetical protein